MIYQEQASIGEYYGSRRSIFNFYLEDSISIGSAIEVYQNRKFLIEHNPSYPYEKALEIFEYELEEYDTSEMMAWERELSNYHYNKDIYLPIFLISTMKSLNIDDNLSELLFPSHELPIDISVKDLEDLINSNYGAIDDCIEKIRNYLKSKI